MRFDGLSIGVIAFLIIGIFHPIVVKGEYYFTEKIWPLFLLAGIIALALSCFVRQTLLSSALGVLGCTCLWSVLELKKQTKRKDISSEARESSKITVHSYASTIYLGLSLCSDELFCTCAIFSLFVIKVARHNIYV
ncbi:MAG: DUF4491 family protein [Synergistaceae bacterium]|jgi:hypothetical protein|nr:DUF4491 family protein [Synergistaceae bacterium]